VTSTFSSVTVGSVPGSVYFFSTLAREASCESMGSSPSFDVLIAEGVSSYSGLAVSSWFSAGFGSSTFSAGLSPSGVSYDFTTSGLVSYREAGLFSASGFFSSLAALSFLPPFLGISKSL